ncbi:ATP-binding protein [Pollutimonas bauzanensis]|jgi:signal transduction histidine kinase|uniref:sensor histidine kinase n=1 Tax=Pollutimonas bauzanensis TaxID=658167 RepID=UPI00333ED368
MPRGSLARHLVLRLLPAVVVLVVLDLSVTWVMTQKISLEAWLLRDLFWTMVLSQAVLISVFAWVLISGVRSGLASINRLSQEISQRSIDDLQTLDVAGLPTEVAPLVTHFNDLLSRLDDSMQAQKRFIGHAAHQLRTPLAGLKMESELMLTRNLPDDVRERAERIKTVTDRMIRLGQQLLVLARADSSTRPQDSFVRRDLCEWVRSSGAEWIPAARARHIDIQLIAPEDPVWVDVDPILLEELLNNLIDNALRYGVEASAITLRVAANPPSLTVEDDGPGIDNEDSERVFEAFYRSSHAGAGGSGLGLAIVREIARAHGAWWNLNSRPVFPGTRITIVFPGPRIGAKLRRQE